MSNPHTHHETFISLQALLSLQEDVPSFVGEYVPRIYHSYTLHIRCTFHILTSPDRLAFQADLQRGTGAVRLDLELLKQCLQ